MGATHVKNHLFAEPSLIGGMARVVDLGATLQDYNYSRNTAEADTKALINDWFAIGDDIRHSLNQYERTRKE